MPRRNHFPGLLFTGHVPAAPAGRRNVNAWDHLSDRPYRCAHGHPVLPRPALRIAMADVRTYPDPAAAGPVPTPGGPLSYIHWGPALAGAVVAAATLFVLMAFASAVGLMVVSPSPTWRDTSVWLAILSGFWIIVVATGSFALGGYLAGRVRSTWKAPEGEVEVREGAEGLPGWASGALGLLVWAVVVVLGVVRIWAGATAASLTTAASRDASAQGFLAYELDRLFRSERRLEPVAAEVRAEATRVLMKGLGRNELPSE